MLTTVVPANGLQLYRSPYAVRSAITATAELLMYLYLERNIWWCWWWWQWWIRLWHSATKIVREYPL